MAITKIHSIKSTLNLSIEYICDPNKTDGQLLISSYSCEPELASLMFEHTRSTTESKCGQKNTVLAHHLIQAFNPEDSVTAEQVHQMGIELADKLLKGNHEYVIATHIDKGHIHNHIIFNSINFNTNRTFHYEQNRGGKIFLRIQKINDEICKEHELSIVEKKSRNKGKGHYEWEQDKRGTSWKTTLKHTIDDTIKISSDFDDFLNKIREQKYEVRYEDYKTKEGKILAFKAEEQKYWIYAEKLGWYYEEKQLNVRIERAKYRRENPNYNSSGKPYGEIDKTRVRQLIDINSNAKYQDEKGLNYWARLQNLQNASKTINFLATHGLSETSSIDDLNNVSMSIHDKHIDIADKLKEIENLMRENKNRQKYTKTYKELKPIDAAYKNAKDQDKYFREHERELILFEAAKKALLQSEASGYLPNLHILEDEYSALNKQKENLLEQYQSSKREIKEMETVQKNVETIIQGQARAKSVNEEEPNKAEKESDNDINKRERRG